MVVFLAQLQNYLNYRPEMRLNLILWEHYIPVHSHSAQELIERVQDCQNGSMYLLSPDHLTCVAIHAKCLHDFLKRLHDFYSDVLGCFIVSQHCEFLSSVPDFTLFVRFVMPTDFPNDGVKGLTISGSVFETVTLVFR